SWQHPLERCMSVMQSGTQMVKLKAGSKGLLRLFYLDEHRSCIRWKPSRKSEKAKITIDSLYKVTEGHQSDIFHRHAEGGFEPACCFTVYHGNHMESLDLVTSNADEARTWVTGLRYLMAGISDEDSLARRAFETWMKQTFEEADKNGDGLLNIEEIYQLLHKLNVNLPRRKVKQMFQEADTDDQQGSLTYEEFSVFYKMMSLRRDLFLLMMAYSDRRDHLTAEELAVFLRTEQKMTTVTPEYCADIIDKFEESSDYKQKGLLGIEGFTSFMRSPACDVFNPLHREVNQDMEQPLCNYFIASSHNTYLTGDQLLSHSKTDMYAWVLQSGCRCVEVDCWDGPDGDPVVQHGYTLTSKIPFRAVIETINKYAFVNNRYPVILSIENHCNIQQQKKIAQYLREILGDKLDLGHILSRESKNLPSPNSLQGKILIKVRRGATSYVLCMPVRCACMEGTCCVHVCSYVSALNLIMCSCPCVCLCPFMCVCASVCVCVCVCVQRHSKSRLTCQSVEKDDDEQDSAYREAGGQFNRGGRKRKTMKLSRDLSDLVVFTNSMASQECLDEGTPGDVLSFSEARAQSLVHHRAPQFLAFNQRQLSRIYPSAYRIDSSNFNPQFYWNVGCQLVALNYQTEGRMMQLNRAKFMVNGGSGYVLKPPPMCQGSLNPFCDDPLPAYPKKQLMLKIISGQQLPKPPDSMLGDRGEIIDPFVEVEIIGLPADCCKEQTRVVDDNGFNPVWEETLSFTLHMAEVALVRFLVWDHDPIGRDFVGQRTVAFSSLMPGYRHIYLEGLTEASIFVHISVHEIYGKGHQLRGIRGFFSRSSKSSVEANSPAALKTRSISDHLLRRTASAPAKGRKKTKLALTESMASISDPRPSPDRPVGPAGESVQGPEGAMEKRPQLRPSLTHRPISMPLDRLLEGQLSLCSSEKGRHHLGADAVIGGCYVLIAGCTSLHLEIVCYYYTILLIFIGTTYAFAHYTASSLSTGMSPLDRPRSTSVGLLIESSATDQLSFSTPSKTCTDRITQRSKSVDTSHLVIGEEDERSGKDYSKEQSQELPNQRKMMGRQATETSSDGTTYTVAPSAPSSGTPLSPVNMDRSNNLRSPNSLQDSTLSRLIDAVSLGNENDTRGSISALIGQFDNTVDQSNRSTTSNGGAKNEHQRLNGFLNLSVQNCSTPNQSNIPHKGLQDYMSPLCMGSSNGQISIKGPISPQKAQKSDSPNTRLYSPRKISQADQPAPPAPASFHSPETTEQEEVYTILDEEVLSPTSMYNLKKQTVHFQALDSMRSTQTSNGLGFSPSKLSRGLGSEDGMGRCVDQEWRGGHPMEVEESVYEEVYDPAGPILEPGRGVACSYNGYSVDRPTSQFSRDMAGCAYKEVEINVDEDPLERMLPPSRHVHMLTSPTKRHAIYQNNDSAQLHRLPQIQPSSSYNAHQSSPHKSQYSQRSSPVSKPYFQQPQQSQLVSNSQPSLYQRSNNSQILMTQSPLRQNSYPSPQYKPESYVNNKDFAKQRNYNGSNGMNGFHRETGNTIERELVGHFQSSPSASEFLPAKSVVSRVLSRERAMCSPTPYSDGAHGQLDTDCHTPESHYVNFTSPSHPQTPRQTTSPREVCSHLNDAQQRQPDATRPPSEPRLEPFPSLPQSGPVSSQATGPSKSKSLGDLTSEDISCNFQSKYHIISRSFITPHMRDRKRIGTLGRPAPPAQSSDPLTQQLRRLLNLDPRDTVASSAHGVDVDGSPPPLTRRLSSRSQSRVRHINSRARERQQEALKPRSELGGNGGSGGGGVVLRSKPVSQTPAPNRHSTGSYIAGYLGQLEDRGLPEGSCAPLQQGYADRYGDGYYGNYSHPMPADSSYASTEPEVYFLLRL
uniref:Phosphoinositide phospholipase C n=1 Tax=Gadus morhua TaxID=8049 RepID=A0A8C5CVA3_GADMO